MSKKTAPPPARSRRKHLTPALLGLVVLGLTAAGTHWWRQEARAARVQDALPEQPTALPNAPLQDLVASAHAAATRGDLAAVAELGRLYHANEFRREAEACWRLLIREQPGEARWHYYLADLLRMTGDQAAVEEQLQLTVAADPAAATAWLQLAEMKFKSGRHDAAAGDYRQRLALQPDDPYAELGLARVAQLQGRMEETLQRLERVLARHPKFSAAQNLYAELQAAAGREDLADLHRWLGREAGRFREADDPWMEELNTRCREPRRLCHLGVIAYQTAQGDRGRARFEQAIALAPGYPLAYELLGALLNELGEAGAAGEILARGIERAANARPSPLHYLELSEARATLGQPGPARRAVADGLARHPDSADLLHAHGQQLQADGRTDEAIAAYRRAVAVNPAFVEADFSLAALLLETGRPREAVAALNHALAMQPTFPKAMLLMARLEVDAGRVEKAGDYLLPLLKANPGAPDIREITASWRLRAGRAVEPSNPAAAERHYRAGLALQPDEPRLNASLGYLLLTTGRAAEAVPLLEIFHRALPTNLQGALILGQAYAATGRAAEARRILSAGLEQARQSGPKADIERFQARLAELPP